MRNLNPRKIRFIILINGILLLVAIAFLIPFYYMTVSAFKPDSEIASAYVTLLPKNPTLTHYYYLFDNWPLLRNIFNSFFVAGSVTLLNLFFCSLAGLAFAKFHFPARNRLFLVTLGTMMFPFQMMLIPMFIIMGRLHWINTYYALIIPAAVGAFGIFFMRQYISASVPGELLDAARIDGCSEFGLYWRVVVPAIKPALIVLGLIIFMNTWNDFLWPMVVLTDNKMYTLSLLTGVAGQRPYFVSWGDRLAAATVTAYPPVVVFFLFRRQFVQAILSGAFKG